MKISIDFKKKPNTSEVEISTEFPSDAKVSEIQQVLIACHNALSDQLERIARKKVAEHKWLGKDDVQMKLRDVTIQEISE